MHRHFWLYINVGTLSNYTNTFQMDRKKLPGTLINTYTLPNKPFMEKNQFLLNHEGKTHISTEENTWKTMIYPFELKLKPTALFL